MDTNAQNPQNEPNGEDPKTDGTPHDELTEEKLRKQLEDYSKALAEEFEDNQKKHPEKVIENTLEFFQGMVPMACAQIAFLAEHSTSDSTRASCSKYIIERVFKGSVDSPTDPVAAILTELMNTGEIK